MNRAGQRVSGPLVSMGTINFSYTLFVQGTNDLTKLRIKKIMWCNRCPLSSVLRIGYLTNATPGIFIQVLPDIFMIGGSMTDELVAWEIPETGNAPDGFIADATPLTGTNGNIIGQVPVTAAVPFDVQVKIEVEGE